MGYFDELDAWLTAVLLATEDDQSEEDWFARVKKQIKDKVLESYHNGKAAGAGKAKPEAEEPRDKKTRYWPGGRKSQKRQ